MVAAPLLAMLLTAASGSTCRTVVQLRGEDPAAVAELSETLARAGFDTRPSVQACTPVGLWLDGRAPPYRLQVQDADGLARRFDIHLVEMAVPLVESAVGAVRLPRPRVEPADIELALTARTEVALDSTGTAYAGPGLRASLCSDVPCLDLVGHFGLGLGTRGPRQEVGFGAGGSLQAGSASNGWAVDIGAAIGGRWVREVVPSTVDPTIAWTVEAWPFTDTAVSNLQVAVEVHGGLRGRIFEGVALDAHIAVSMQPQGELRPRYDVLTTADAVVRLGLGLRWGVER